MLKDLMSIMEKKMSAKGKMDPLRQKAKLEMLGALKDRMDDSLGEDVKKMKMNQVTVAAPDKEKLAKGLDMAKEVIGEQAPSEEKEEEDEEEEGEMPESEDPMKMALDKCEDVSELEKLEKLISAKKLEMQKMKV